MPINDKQQEFILEYCSNGHNASEAYRKAYPKVKSGWNAHGARLIAKDSIKQAISEHMAELAVETGYTVEQCQLEYELARQLAITLKQPSAVVSAITGKARLYGMDKDASTHQDKTPTYTQAELNKAAALAKELTKPILHKDTA